MYDVIILGMGPAGMSAGIYAKRSNLNVLLLEKNAPGGLVSTTNKVDNYIGFDDITGSDLAYKMFEHLLNNEVEYKIEEVTDIILKDDYKEVVTNQGTYKTKAVILAGGRQKRKPDFAKRLNLDGKGISYCAVCDGALYKGKDVVVVGAGNSAFEEGIYLAGIVNKVTILCRSENVRADAVLVDTAKKTKNMEIMFNSEIVDVILKDGAISEVVLNNNQKISTSAIFIYAGFEPATGYLDNLDVLNENGYIEVDEEMKTKVKGIYACGDAIKKTLYQIISAASEGAIAATSVKKDITQEVI